MKNAKMINYGEMVKTTARRRCTCKSCGEKMVQGDDVYKYFSTMQNGITYCINCVNAILTNFEGSFASTNKDYNAKTTKNHSLVVRGFLLDFPYFGSKGLTTYKNVNGVVGDFSSYEVNRYTTGHVVGTALKHNWRVFIDGVEIFSFEDLDAITR